MPNPRNNKRICVGEVFPELLHCTRRNLQSLLRRIKDNPDALTHLHHSSESLSLEYRANFNLVRCSEVYPYSDKPGNFEMHYADPGLLAQLMLTKCEPLAKRWVTALRTHPGTSSNPWHVVIGYDEFQPGSKLDFDKAKAVMCLYFNFVEVGASSEGATWLNPVAVRVTEMSSVVGGWSRILACIVHRMFLGPNGFSNVGVTFCCDGRDYIVFAKLGILLSDGEGIQKGIGWKGANGIKASLVHGNILKKNSDLAGRLPGFVEVTCSDHTELHKTTEAEFNLSCDLVVAAVNRRNTRAITKGYFNNILKTEGMNYVPGGIAFDARLRNSVGFFPAVTMDWVHTYLQDGVFSVEALLMIQAFSPAVTPDMLVIFLKLPWRFPHHHMQTKGQLLWKIFSMHRLDEDGSVDKVRASASELMGLYSLMRHYFATQVVRTPEQLPNCLSFEACCAIMDLIIAAKRQLVSPRRAANELRTKIGRFMALHTTCYGSDYVKPKHAWQWAIAEHWDRDDCVWDAFIIERLHLLVKATSARFRYTPNMEEYTLSGTMNSQIVSMQTLKGSCCFLDPPVATNVLPDTLFADSMMVWGMPLRVDDVVFYDRNAGKLVACALENGLFYGLVEMFIAKEVTSPCAQVWQIDTGDVKLVPAVDLTQALALTY